MNWEEHIRESIFFIILLLGNTLSGYADIPLEQLVDSLNVVLDNKQVYVEKKEQKIQAIKQLLQESNISILQEYDLNDRLYLECRHPRPCRGRIHSALFLPVRLPPSRRFHCR